MKVFRFEDRTLPEPLIIVAESLDEALVEFRVETCANRDARHCPRKVKLLGEYVRVAGAARIGIMADVGARE